MKPRQTTQAGFLTGCIALSGTVFGLTQSGCEKQAEKVIDIEAPGVDVEVHKSDVDDENSASIDIKTGRQ